MSNFTPRSGPYSPKSVYSYKTFTDYNWNHYAPETDGNCTWFAFGETSRIVQECLSDESYNIQYTYGNEFMSSGPSALYWISNAANKGAWVTDGDSRGNYDPASSPLAGTQISLQAGDILCYWSSDGFGHVEVVEEISGGYVYCAGSKASVSQPAVLYYERTVAESQFKVGQRHYFSGEASDGTVISWSNDYFQGIIRNPYVEGDTPGPGPTPGETLDITITPSSYSVTMAGSDDYVDMTFSIVISGIPAGATVSGGNTYPGLDRVANTGWSYTDYVINNVTYRTARKTQTLRYRREMMGSYATTKHMYFNLSFSTGTISTDTPMYITVKMKPVFVLFTNLLRRKRGHINGYIK